MSLWIALKTGPWVNLDLIEAVVPLADGVFRFYPPRAQRGGRPTGRPTERVPGYDDDRGYWEGAPVEPFFLKRALGALGSQLDASGAQGHGITSYTPHSPQGGSHEPQRPYQHQDRVTGSASTPPD